MPINFKIHDFFYPLGIYRLRRLFERTQWFSPEKLRRYQEKRLKIIINHAYEHVPYYSNLFNRHRLKPSDISSIDDLTKLPLLTKDTVRNKGSDLIADNAARYHPIVYKTSGTSGTPFKLYLDKNANILEFVYYWRHWSWAGYKLGDRFAQFGSQFFLRRNLNGTALWQPHLRRLMLNSGQIALYRAKEMAQAIRKYQPKFLKGLASSLYFLALCLKESGITDISFKAIFSTGEVLSPQYRALAESVFNCPVLDSYGHMEGAVAISQCLHGSYHVNSDYGILGFDNHQASSDGKTRLARAIGTSLYNLAMPFIRYDVGDDIELFVDHKNCPCGRTLPIVKAIHGRSEDTIITPDGRFITAMFTLPELVNGVRFVQFVQEKPNILNINIVPGKGWNDIQKEKLGYYTAKLVGENMSVDTHLITDDDIITGSSGKIRSVISLV